MNKMMTTMLMFTLAAMTAVSGSSLPFGFDVNNDGRIDRAEFHWANPDVVDLHQAFGKFDLNNDGFINQDESRVTSDFCRAEIIICQNQFPHDGFAFRNCVEPGCHQFSGRANLNNDANTAFNTGEEVEARQIRVQGGRNVGQVFLSLAFCREACKSRICPKVRNHPALWRCQ